MTKQRKYAKALEIIWGGAVGDAIGNPLEFRQSVTAKTAKASADMPELLISDDTQMSLFRYEALLIGDTTPLCYLDWYQTQNEPFKPGKAGLLGFESLYRREAPGGTCMGSCLALDRGEEVVNDSKGNGTVMRAAAFAVNAVLTGQPKAQALAWAKADALQTHQHPLAWQSSVVLVGLLLALLDGQSPREALTGAALCHGATCSPVVALLQSMGERENYLSLKVRGRAGWVAEECLALAFGAVLHHTGFDAIVRAACTGEGIDSDTVAGVAGQLAVAAGFIIPSKYKEKILAKDAIGYITQRYANPSLLR